MFRPPRRRGAVLAVAVWAFRLGYAGPSPAPAAKEIPWDNLDKILAEFERINREAAPAMQSLEALRTRYDGVESIETLKSERRALLASIRRSRDEHEKNMKRFRKAQNVINMHALVTDAGKYIKGGHGVETGKNVARMVVYDQAMTDVKAFGDRYHVVLHEDRVAFRKLKRRLERRRQRQQVMLAAAGAGAMVLAALCAWLLLHRRQAAAQ